MIFYDVPASVNESLVRKGEPVNLKSAAIPPVKWAVRSPAGAVDRMHPKGITTDVPRSKIAGDPIRQLNSTRNTRPRFVPPGSQADWKRGDFEGIGDKMPIKRESEMVRARRKQALLGHFQTTLRAQAGRVTLGNGAQGDGLNFYRKPRIKPALPNGRMDIARVTANVKRSVGAMYLHTTMPVEVKQALAAQGADYDTIGGSNPLPVGQSRVYALSPADILEASDDPANTKGQPNQTLVLLAAVFVAWLVLKGGH